MAPARVRWLIAGAFHPTPTGQRFPLTADTFGERLALATRGLSVTVKDRLGAGDASTYALQFDGLDAFSLSSVIESQPDLRALRALHEALSGTRPLAPEEAARLQATVGTGRLAEALNQARRSSPDARGAALSLLEEALFSTAKDLLQHPLVARLESAWRGLHWLWTHCPPHSGMGIEVLDVAPSGLEDALTASLEGPPLHCPDACFLVDGSGAPGTLSRWAALGEQASVPMVVALPLSLGDEGQRLASERDFHLPEAWSQLRADETSRWLCAAVNPVVVKAERQGTVRRECFTSPVFAVAALLAASFRDTHAFARLVGAGSATRAPAVWRPRGEGAPLATEVGLSLREQERLASRGLLGVSGWPDSDGVNLVAAPTVHAGRDATPLPAQLLTGRIVRMALELAERLPAQATREEVSAVCTRAAEAFLPTGTTKGGCELHGQIVPTGRGERGLHLRATLRPELAGTPLRLEFTVPLRG